MTKVLHTLRFAATLGLASLGGSSALATDQTPAGDAQRAADAAQQIALEAENAIRAIDPTTGEASLLVDPSLPRPFGPPAEEIATIEADLDTPFAAIDGQVTAGEAASDAPSDAQSATPPAVAARGPAVRMISRPVVQAVPAALPVAPPVAAPKPAVERADPFTLKSVLTIPEGPFRYGDWYWDESNAPSKGKLVVTVDLDARVISAFRDGHEIGTAVALLGTKKHPTPLGSFPILTKEKDNISEKYNNAPMPWTLRLTWDGIAIHGSPVINGYASHGCIGVPDEFAEKLYAIARRGDKVVITRGQMIGVGDKLS
ncbi:MAG: L,D-transpeptidase family protein [Pseudomonadota bacterium]